MPTNFRGLQERLRQRLLAHIAAGELTGLQLAQQTGFRQAHMSNFLNRKRGLSLEAMDAVLRAINLTVDGLLREETDPPSRRHSLHASSPGLTHIPLLEGADCFASEVPYSERQNTLWSLLSRLEKLPVRAHVPRPHWTRFVAIRAGRADALAMTPRLTAGSVAVIDRHSNAPDGESIYLARADDKLVLRYVEEVDGCFVLRAENPRARLLPLRSGRRGDPLAAIVGRVCLILNEV